MARYGTFKHQGIPLKLDDGCYGEQFFVDGTSGHDGNLGTVPGKAFKTIQKAIDIQIENATGLGDKITVFPGTYVEALTGNLSQCDLVGYRAFAVRVQPAASHAYSGNLHDARIAGIMFDSPTTSNLDYAAMRCTSVEDSIIEECLFGKQGGASENSVGFMLGTYATASTTVKFHRSIFRNNQILANGGGNCFYYGFGMCSGSGDATNGNSRTMWNSRIEDNIIIGSEEGVRLISNYAGSYGTVIQRNLIAGGPLNHGETLGYGMYFLDDTSVGHEARIFVLDNRIYSDSDAIKGFQPSMTQGNIVAIGNDGQGAPAAETA